MHIFFSLRLIDKSNWIGTALVVPLAVQPLVKTQQNLIFNGVLVLEGGLYHFTLDYSFSSLSTPVSVVLSRSTGGRIEWKDALGRTLKELQEAETRS